MAECIHGLEVPLCDSCYPKKSAEVETVTRRSAHPRTAGSGARSAPNSSASAVRMASFRLGDQRLYHAVRLADLAAIIETGAVIAPGTWIPEPDVDPARRASSVVDASRSVSDFVAFALTPESRSWRRMRDAGATRDDDVAAASVADFVVLVTSFSALGDVAGEIVVADDDAGAPTTRFTTDAEQVIRRLRGIDELDRAEALVPGLVPLEAIQLIGVANDPVRDRVRELTGIRVAVYPPWFAAA